MNYEKFIREHQLDPKKFREALAFCLGNPWENSYDADGLNDSELIKSAEELAQLVLKGQKTATASDFASYAQDNVPLPKVDGKYDIVLNGQGKPVCAITTTKVYRVKFSEVTAEHACKEGEGDLSLNYWRQVHEDFFRTIGVFSPEMDIVCEEFRVIS
ncbi:ASCH domain-containing protein [Lactovum odontotermitis]